ncbi:unnamed protein product [Dibothriocephalus latus]|uniref:Uncharacterized protein n=1 Tax=Dibothriocephalus latus TaxID=60516 RepID=A0A3P7NLL7_DIBLA|nr:unnamed protein product [Dibothriocephalus latus]
MHPTSNTNEKPTVTLAQPTKQLFQCALDANETISEQDAASALIELLQRDSESLLAKVLQASRPLSRDCSQPESLLHYGQIALNCLQTKSLPSALEKLTPILEFFVAMSYFSGQSLRWTRTLACNCPSGEMRASEGDCHDRPPDSQLPLRLLMVTAMIELRLRLLTAMSTTEDKEELVDAMSDDAVSELFLQLLDFSDLLLESLVSWNSTLSTDSMDACNEDISNTVLGCLATFLRWTVFYMTNHFLSVVDDAAAFDETFFKPGNPSSAEYMALANRFKNKFWLPVLPVIQRVIPLAFRFSAEPICTDNRDQVRVEFLAVCRISICSLARMFPRVLLSTINFGTVDFVNCLSLDLSSPHLHSTSSCEESLSSQKRLFELTDGICDLTLLLDTGLSSAESLEKAMSQVDQLVAASSENSGQPMPLKDACIPLLGRLFFELLDAKKQSVLGAVLSTQSPPGTGIL